MQSGATALPLVVELAEPDVERPEPYSSSANWPVLSVRRATVRSYEPVPEHSIRSTALRSLPPGHAPAAAPCHARAALPPSHAHVDQPAARVVAPSVVARSRPPARCQTQT